jgi:peptidoglycan/LPS O-acetylase OafA/YrhL
MTQNDHPVYRPDIDGLRAFAVLSVVGFHAFPAVFPGGFVGVDIFFVISGFLISGIILKGLASGSFSFQDFYLRRVKRIFPALVLVVATSLVAGYFLLLADEYKQLAKHAISGLFFVANFALWTEAGYFDTSAEFKPFLHLWSLGIEEQFYMLWPLLLWCFWRWKQSLLLTIGVLAALSFVANLVWIDKAPVMTFYWPHTRFWELLAGASLAAVLQRAPSNPLDYRQRNIAGWLGIALLLGSTFGLDRLLAFPGYWAMVPVLGAVLIILAGPEAWINRNLLSRPGAVFIGLISYPLYLWHWPLLTFPRIINGEETAFGVRLVALGIAFLLAWLTYALLERQVRFRPSWRVPAALAAGALMVAAVAQVVKSQEGMVDRLPFVQAAQASFKQSPSETPGCLRQLGLKGGHCVASANAVAASGKTVMFIGDSHARALAQGFSAFANGEPAEYRLLSLGERGCLAFAGVERVDRGRDKLCRQTIADALAYAEKSPMVDTVVLVGRFAMYHSGYEFEGKRNTAVRLTHRSVAGNESEQSNPLVFEAGLRSTVAELQRAGKRVVFFNMVPELGFSPRRCVARPFAFDQEGERCAVTRAAVDDRQRAYRATVSRVLKDYPELLVFDPAKLLCSDIHCPAVRQEQLLYRDDDHLNTFGATLVMQEFMGWLDRQKSAK